MAIRDQSKCGNAYIAYIAYKGWKSKKNEIESKAGNFLEKIITKKAGDISIKANL